MPADPEPIHEFPYRARTGAGTMILRIFQMIVVSNGIARTFTHPSTLNTVILVVFIIFTAFTLIIHFCKPDVPPTFFISETHAGFGNPHRAPSAVPFASVTQCIESPSGLSLVHDSISVPLGIDLRRHDFAIGDWETLTSLLIQRVREHAPNARVRTLLDPPEDP